MIFPFTILYDTNFRYKSSLSISIPIFEYPMITLHITVDLSAIAVWNTIHKMTFEYLDEKVVDYDFPTYTCLFSIFQLNLAFVIICYNSYFWSVQIFSYNFRTINIKVTFFNSFVDINGPKFLPPFLCLFANIMRYRIKNVF